MLFDLGTSRLFVSAMFARLSKLATELFSKSFGIMLSMGDVVVYSKVVIGYPLMLCGHVLEVDLMVFNILRSDIILRMDWLSQHYACINFHSWTVSFQSLEGETMEIPNAKLRTKPIMISVFKLRSI